MKTLEDLYENSDEHHQVFLVMTADIIYAEDAQDRIKLINNLREFMRDKAILPVKNLEDLIKHE